MIHGVTYLKNGECSFSVWAPLKNKVTLHIVHPTEKEIEMRKDEQGYFNLIINGLTPRTQYFFNPDGEKDYPDPASHYQPDDVHGPSEVVDHRSFKWNDASWQGLPLKDMILYELHVGTFTPEGTFEAIIPRLDELYETGINAIEIMPVAQFPGNRNWGYDGVYTYAVQNSYGGPAGLKTLVDACHQRGIAVFLDVVYNHLGPEGNYFSRFAPYFTDKYKTPWGDAINYDDEWSDGVREYFSNNSIHWFENYHIDALRLDAIHTVYDNGAVHFWEMCYNKVKEAETRLGRKLYMTAESDLNAPRVIKTPEFGGYGFDAQWLDDFHHILYVLLDEKGKELYVDFGKIEQLAKAYTEGFVHSGEYVKFRKKKYGRPSTGVSGEKFIVFSQNHDQVGNRVRGERLSVLVDFEKQKIAAAAIILSPYIPMLFMGEEYAEKNPFLYFVSHSDPELIKAVREGRKEEFKNYKWNTEPPDPQDEKTFNDSKLQWHKRNDGIHKIMQQWIKRLIQLRRSNIVFQNFDKSDIKTTALDQSALILQRQSEDGIKQVLCLFNFSAKKIPYTFSDGSNNWIKLLDSTEAQWREKSEHQETVLPSHVKAGGLINIPAYSVTVYDSE